MKKTSYIYILTICLIIFSAIIISKSLSKENNTLYNNGNWNTTKLDLAKGTFYTSTSFMYNNFALTNKVLNMGMYYGFNEVYLKERIVPKYVKFDFTLKNSFLNIFFENETRTGILISNNNLHDSVFYITDKEGRFNHRVPLNLTIKQSTWQNLEIRFEENLIKFILNNKIIYSEKSSIKNLVKFGFSSGETLTNVDNLVIKNTKGEKLKDNFEPKKQSIIPILFGIITLNILFILIKLKDKDLFFKLFFLNIIILLISIIFFIYESQKVDLFELAKQSKIEQINLENKETIINELQTKYQINSNKHRIMFIGTSQTWGSGVLNEKNSFVNRFKEKLTQINSNFEVINAAIPGMNSKNLIDFFDLYLIKYNPEIVVIILSSNDENKTIFKTSLEKIIKINNENNIKTVFVLEANYPNSRMLGIHSFIIPNHKIMRELGLQNNISIIDMHHYLSTQINEGILWRDYVHLTDFGYKLYSEKLFNELNNIFNFENYSISS